MVFKYVANQLIQMESMSMNKYVKYFIIGTGVFIVFFVLVLMGTAAMIILNGIQDGTLI